MPRYYFNLKDGHQIVCDPEGMDLQNEDFARAHACGVARELMRNRERQTRSWRLVVCDIYGVLVFEVPFDSIGDLVSNLPSLLPSSFADVCRKTASLNEAIKQVRITLTEVRDTIAQSDTALLRSSDRLAISRLNLVQR